MGIIHVRVDDRLIHGQIAAMWTHHLSATRIIVVDDKATNDEMLKMYLRLATPKGVSLSVLSIKKASERLIGGYYDSQRIFIITRSAGTLCQLADLGASIKEVHVGNLAFTEGNTKVSDSIFLSKESINDFKQLMALGIKLIMQPVPADIPDDFGKILKEV